MSTGTQVKRAPRPSVIANSSTGRSRIVGNSAVKKPRVAAQVSPGRGGRRKVGA